MLVLRKLTTIAFCATFLLFLQACSSSDSSEEEAKKNWQWEVISASGKPTPRHEASFLEHQGLLYLLGGRRINPVNVFDPKTSTWSSKSQTPLEIHHFQAVSLGDAIYIVGAMTGQYPNEVPLANVIAYYPSSDTFKTLHEIPESRRRGGAGAVVYNGKIYVVGGIKNGHVDGYVPWLDEYNPVTGEWIALPDASFARDHVQAVVLKDKLHTFGGRTSRQRTNQVLELLVKYGESFDLKTKRWEPVKQDMALPTLRAGNSLLAWGDEIIVAGGESHTQELAHFEMDSFNTVSRAWSRWPDPVAARHGTGFAVADGYAYIASGSANRGGGPELDTIERLKLPQTHEAAAIASNAPSNRYLNVHQNWHTVTIDFEGPELSETGTPNLFTDYRLDIEFTNQLGKRTVRGFYAADGDAANTSADSGKVWRVRFTPHMQGKWVYSAVLRSGENVAIGENLDKAKPVEISNAKGEFYVVDSDKEMPDFRAKGFVAADGPYFRFRDSNEYWIKAGANSPENILGFHEFDGTYQHGTNDREGEASTSDQLHRFEPHLKDWKTGDPTWQGDKGKALIGAYNYLASKGMNSNYFLTMNIDGDGKDVWPFVSHDDFTRFDVSKLEQWNIVFEHMQAKGVLLHATIQETENERLFDDGEMGPQRKLYLNELIARFSHHPGLVWNLGEENGPVPFSPVGQNDQQRKDMSSYFEESDPYDHTVLLHTHSTPKHKEEIVAPQLGHVPLDGLSFQVEKRAMVNGEIQKWRARSKAAGKEWLISMDEIGTWQHGAITDAEDPDHDRLRHWVLWGTLLGGGAGVEWYFGAKHEGTDLSTEDWRPRERLWELSNHARVFFEDYVPYWQMTPNNALISQLGDSDQAPEDHPENGGPDGNVIVADVGQKPAFAFAKEGDVYVGYLSNAEGATLDLSSANGDFSLHWFDPLTGGELQLGDVEVLAGGSKVSLGKAPTTSVQTASMQTAPLQDWVILVRKM